MCLKRPSELNARRRPGWLWRIAAQFGVAWGSITFIAFVWPTAPVFWATLINFSVVVLSVWAFGHWFDRRPFAQFGLQFNTRWWQDFGWGVLVGLAPLLLLGLSALTGVVRLELRAAVDWLGLGLLTVQYLAVSGTDELARAYPLQNAAEGLEPHQSRWALFVTLSLTGLISSAFYRGDSAYLPFIVLDAVLYGLCYLWTGRLALALAHHWAVDVVFYALVNVGAFMGLPPTAPALFDLRPSGPTLEWTPALLTFAVVFAVSYLSLSALGLLWWAKRSGK